MSHGIRMKNVAPGSALGEFLIRTEDHVTPANDEGKTFCFPRATRIQLMEMGITAGGTFTGTSIAAEVAYLDAGLTGSEALLQQPITPGYTILRTHVGVSAYELTDTGFRIERPADHQPHLAMLGRPDTTDAAGRGTNSYNTDTNLNIRIALMTTGMSALTGWAWARIKVWYPEDE